MENKTPKSDTKTTRQMKRSSAFMHMVVLDCVDTVDMTAEQYADLKNFIRAVILELKKLT